MKCLLLRPGLCADKVIGTGVDARKIHQAQASLKLRNMPPWVLHFKNNVKVQLTL
jgi:hypothetical protein